MTNKRSCKFCGETGHNIRSCTSAASARNLISKFGRIVQNEVPSVAKKHFPLSGFEGNLISMNFKLADTSTFFAKPENSFIDHLDYYQRRPIDNAIYELLKEAGSTDQYNDHMILGRLLVPVFETDNIQLGFFVEEGSFTDHWNSIAEMSLVADEIDFKISNYIQNKLHEPGGNKYKTLWRKICEHTGLTENYRGWEGNEGEVIRSFLEEAVKELQRSAGNKRTDPNKMFAVISSRLGRTQKAPAPKTRCGVYGEWMHIEAPQISFTWRDRNADCKTTIELTDNLKKKIVEAVKQPYVDALFEKARNSIQDFVGGTHFYRHHSEKDALSLDTIYKLLNERHFTFDTNAFYQRRFLVESLEIDDDVLYNEEPPPAVISSWEKACKTGSLSAERTVKDFVKMGHSGGYAQMFEKGLMKKIKFPGLQPELDLQEKSEYDGKWYDSRWVGRRYQPSVSMDTFSLSEIVLAALEALVYSEREVK